MGSQVHFIKSLNKGTNPVLSKKHDTLVIMPAYNEAWNIISLIDELSAVGEYDILVVNDASKDNTGILAENTGKAFVINLPHNLGIGGCVQTGFKFARNYGYEYVLQFDADGQHLVKQIPRLLKLVKLNKADVVVGSRFNKKHKGFRSSYLRRTGIKILKLLTMLLIHQRIKDCTSGFRAYNQRAFTFLCQNYPTDFPEPEALILLGKHKFTISEVFTKMQERRGGKSSIQRNGIFYMVKVMLSMVMTYSRSKQTISDE